MAKSTTAAPASADAEIERLEKLIGARRTLKNAEQAMQDEHGRHARIASKLEGQLRAARQELAGLL